VIFVNDSFGLAALFALYWIIRLAVRHGMTDAFERDRRQVERPNDDNSD
jgi:hypothetical protein